MNDHIGSIVCPNCGASSSSRQKCDFCGSVLVRYADKEVKDIDAKFGKSVRFIPGLDVALENNLSIQETCPENSIVITRIYPPKEESNNINAINLILRKNKEELKGDPNTWFYSFPDKTALGTSCYEIISSKDSSYGTTIGARKDQEYGLVFRFPFAEKNMTYLRKYSLAYDPNNPRGGKWVDTYMGSDYSSLRPPTKVEEVFRERIDYEGMFKAYRYDGGLCYLLDLGQDVESASRIITYYVQLLEKASCLKMPSSKNDYFYKLPFVNRNIYTFDVETRVLDKNNIILDTNTGNIVEKTVVENMATQSQSTEKQSFWKKLFG